MTGLKYENNPTSKKLILERVDGYEFSSLTYLHLLSMMYSYMKRAEEIKNVLADTQNAPKGRTVEFGVLSFDCRIAF